MKKASREGKTQIWFKDFLVSLPHIVNILPIKEENNENNYPALPLMNREEAERRWLGFSRKRKELLKKMSMEKN